MRHHTVNILKSQTSSKSKTSIPHIAKKKKKGYALKDPTSIQIHRKEGNGIKLFSVNTLL